MSNSMFVFDEKKVKEIPMVDIAYEILKQSKKSYSFYDLVKEISNIKGMTEIEVMDNIAQLFTEMNIDGRFIHIGQNEWALKTWFPVDQTDAFHIIKDDDEEDFDEEFEEEEEFEDDFNGKFEDAEDEDLNEDEDDEEEEEEDEVEDFVEDEEEEEEFVEVFDDDVSFDEEEDIFDEDGDLEESDDTYEVEIEIEEDVEDQEDKD